MANSFQRLTKIAVGGLLLASLACNPASAKNPYELVIAVPNKKTAFNQANYKNPVNNDYIKHPAPTMQVTDEIMSYGKTFNIDTGKSVAKYLLPNELTVYGNYDNNTNISTLGLLHTFSTQLPLAPDNAVCNIAKAVFPAKVSIDTFLIKDKVNYHFYPSWDLSVLTKNKFANYFLPTHIKASVNKKGKIEQFEGVWDKSSSDSDGILHKLIKVITPNRVCVIKNAQRKKSFDYDIFYEFRKEF